MLSRSLRLPRMGSQQVCRCLASKPNDSGMSYSDRMTLKGRPVSPHVTIYAFPITATSSIMNRFTGVGLSVGIVGMSALSLVGIDVALITNTIGNTLLIGPLAKLIVAYPLVYHYLGGLRHMAWDNAPDLLETKSVTSSSYALLGGSAAISVILAFITI